MIEEFMLAANEAAATFAREQEIPFVYRVHENPPDEKLETLTAVLRLLGMNTNGKATQKQRQIERPMRKCNASHYAISKNVLFFPAYLLSLGTRPVCKTKTPERSWQP